MYAVLCVCVFGCTVVCARVGGFLSYCVQVCRVCAMHECMCVGGRGDMYVLLFPLGMCICMHVYKYVQVCEFVYM